MTDWIWQLDRWGRGVIVPMCFLYGPLCLSEGRGERGNGYGRVHVLLFDIYCSIGEF